MSGFATAHRFRYAVRDRMVLINDHLQQMIEERKPYMGDPRVAQEVQDTIQSHLSAVTFLLLAEQVWCDGSVGFSFGGLTKANRDSEPVEFAITARAYVPDQEHGYAFAHSPIEWTFHT